MWTPRRRARRRTMISASTSPAAFSFFLCLACVVAAASHAGASAENAQHGTGAVPREPHHSSDGLHRLDQMRRVHARLDQPPPSEDVRNRPSEASPSGHDERLLLVDDEVSATWRRQETGEDAPFISGVNGRGVDTDEDRDKASPPRSASSSFEVGSDASRVMMDGRDGGRSARQARLVERAAAAAKEEREAAAARERAAAAAKKEARLAKQTWRTCGRASQPACAYGVTLTVDVDGGFEGGRAVRPAGRPTGDGSDREGVPEDVPTLRLRQGERSRRLTATLSHGMAEVVASLALVDAASGERVADRPSLVTWSLMSAKERRGALRAGMGPALRFEASRGSGEDGERRHFAVTPGRDLPPGIYDVAVDVDVFRHPVPLTDIAAPEVAARLEVVAQEDPGTVEIIPPPPTRVGEGSADVDGSASASASAPKPNLNPNPNPIVVAAHVRSAPFTVRLSRPADLVLRVGSIQGHGVGAVEADPPVLVFRRDLGEAGMTRTVRLTPVALPRHVSLRDVVDMGPEVDRADGEMPSTSDGPRIVSRRAGGVVRVAFTVVEDCGGLRGAGGMDASTGAIVDLSGDDDAWDELEGDDEEEARGASSGASPPGCEAGAFSQPAEVALRVEEPDLEVRPAGGVVAVSGVPFVVAVTVPQPLAEVTVRPTPVLRTEGGPGYWTNDQISFNVSEDQPLRFGPGLPRTQHVEVTVREGGRACPEAPCKAAFSFSVAGKHKDSFKSRREPVDVALKPRPTLVMPSEARRKLYANRTRTLVVVVPPASDIPGVGGVSDADASGDADDTMTLTLDRVFPRGSSGGDGWNEPLPSSAVTIEPSAPQLVPRAGGAFKFNVTAVGIGSFLLGATLAGSGVRKDSYAVPPPVPISVQAALWADDFDYAGAFGVGGLDKELKTIVRRAFLSHMVPKSVVSDMGIGHVGGILLYGPPGCGKTTLARIIGKMLDTHEPKVVNGPEIMSKFLGESEQKMRELFKDAEADAAAEKREAAAAAAAAARGETNVGDAARDDDDNVEEEEEEEEEEEVELRFEASGNAGANNNKLFESLMSQMREKLAQRTGGGGGKKRRRRSGGRPGGSRRESRRKIHLVIFDEIDSLVKARGRGNGQAADSVYDGITNTLLSKMDGMNRLSNLLIIGTTNRKDLLDDALLRPGRFDLQIEIPLPDVKGREEILKIHTRRMAARGHLASDVDLGALARDHTDSFTGAELEGAVKSAASFAVERALRAQVTRDGDEEDEMDRPPTTSMRRQDDNENGAGAADADRNGEGAGRETEDGRRREVSESDALMRAVKVTHRDLQRAIGDVHPQHRAPQAQFRTLLGGGLIEYGEPLEGVLATLRAAAARARRGGVVLKSRKGKGGDADARPDEDSPGGKEKSEEMAYDWNTKWASGAVAVLLHGPPGCGKSAVAAYVAREADFAFSKVITADSFLDDLSTPRADQLAIAFAEARKHKESLLLLDDVDGMVDHVRTASSMTWNSQQWSQLRLLLRRSQPVGHRLLVLATASSLTVQEFPQVAEMFNLVVEVPSLRSPEHFAAVLRETATFTSTREEAAAVLEIDAEAPIGIKTLLAAIDMAQDVVSSDGGEGGRGGEGGETGRPDAEETVASQGGAEGGNEEEAGRRRSGLLLTPAALRDQLRLAPRGLRRQIRTSPDPLDPDAVPTRGSVVDATARGAGRNATASEEEDGWGW